MRNQKKEYVLYCPKKMAQVIISFMKDADFIKVYIPKNLAEMIKENFSGCKVIEDVYIKIGAR